MNDLLFELNYVTQRIQPDDTNALRIHLPRNFVPRPVGDPRRVDYRQFAAGVRYRDEKMEERERSEALRMDEEAHAEACRLANRHQNKNDEEESAEGDENATNENQKNENSDSDVQSDIQSTNDDELGPRAPNSQLNISPLAKEYSVSVSLTDVPVASRSKAGALSDAQLLEVNELEQQWREARERMKTEDREAGTNPPGNWTLPPAIDQAVPAPRLGEEFFSFPGSELPLPVCRREEAHTGAISRSFAVTANEETGHSQSQNKTIGIQVISSPNERFVKATAVSESNSYTLALPPTCVTSPATMAQLPLNGAETAPAVEEKERCDLEIRMSDKAHSQ